MAIAIRQSSHIQQHQSSDNANRHSNSSHPRESLQLMTDMMSYQYPPPPQNGGDLDLPHSGYLSNYQTSAASSLEVRNQQVPAVHSMQPVLPAQGSTMSLAQRRDLNKALKLRRPETTPNVRTQGTNESAHGQFGSAGEKKRNKLGYHRTSVACSMLLPSLCFSSVDDRFVCFWGRSTKQPNNSQRTAAEGRSGASPMSMILKAGAKTASD
jgi:hypothetical protein